MAVFSLEMATEQLLQRLMCQVGRMFKSCILSAFGLK
ncbi:MAG: DnaB-like helicase C-terminal domain-containing protein [Candidatus Adiutrix sp.]|nr:DnaB-like helicase C-terminal domain-containing protein [Candidatus Adiutrix sp.]